MAIMTITGRGHVGGLEIHVTQQGRHVPGVLRTCPKRAGLQFISSRDSSTKTEPLRPFARRPLPSEDRLSMDLFSRP